MYPLFQTLKRKIKQYKNRVAIRLLYKKHIPNFTKVLFA